MIFKNELWIIIRRIFPHLTIIKFLIFLNFCKKKFKMLHGDYVCKPRGYTGTITEIFQKPRRTVPKTFFYKIYQLIYRGTYIS